MDVNQKVIKQGIVYIPSKLKITDDVDIVFSITKQIEQFIGNNNILLVSIELPAFSAASVRSKQLSMLFGSILQGLSRPYIIVNPTTLKKYATGKGRHSKKESKQVMIDAWKKSNEESYNRTKEYLYSSHLKSVADRGMGDIADSYWLAHYATNNLLSKPKDNPEPITVITGGEGV